MPAGARLAVAPAAGAGAAPGGPAPPDTPPPLCHGPRGFGGTQRCLRALPSTPPVWGGWTGVSQRDKQEKPNSFGFVSSKNTAGRCPRAIKTILEEIPSPPPPPMSTLSPPRRQEEQGPASPQAAARPGQEPGHLRSRSPFHLLPPHSCSPDPPGRRCPNPPRQTLPRSQTSKKKTPTHHQQDGFFLPFLLFESGATCLTPPPREYYQLRYQFR